MATSFLNRSTVEHTGSAAGAVARMGFLGVVAAAVAVPIVVIAYAGGAFATHPRLTLATLVWWSLLCAVATGLVDVKASSAATRFVGLCLLLLSAWTLLSAAWAPAEPAYEASGRVLLFTGVLAVGAFLPARWRPAAFFGVAIAIAAVSISALSSRLVPDLVHVRVFSIEPGWETRLSYPLGYWNALGIFVGLALPLLAGLAARRATRPWVGGVLVALALPIGATIYLTSSRGAVVTAGVGIAVLLLATVGDGRSLVATIATGVATACGLVLASREPILSNGPLGTVAATHAGHHMVLLIVVGSGVVLGATAVALAIVERVPIGRGVARTAVAVVAVATIAAGVAEHPIRQFRAFKAPPAAISQTATEHLTSAVGSGRWELWGAAIGEFRHHPVVGGGGGSFAAWWAQHRPFPLVAHDAHSLYLQTLGELGVVGLLLLAGAFGGGLVIAARSLSLVEVGRRAVPAAALAVYSAYLVALGIDWMWSMTVVSLVGTFVLGLLMPRATVPRRHQAADARAVRVCAVAVALVAALLLLVPLLTDDHLRASGQRASAGHLNAAAHAAAKARALEPWASSPYLQLALVAEQAGDLRDAERWIVAAIRRDDTDWHLWYVRTRVETAAGDITAARRSLGALRKLNPFIVPPG